MEKLKSVIADKIIEVSSNNSEDIRTKLEKINRFRDFADACHTLMKKYPDIESELIRLVENNDFDTKVAASRVDSIIRLSENTKDEISDYQKQEDISELEEIKAKEIIDGEPIPFLDNVEEKIQEAPNNTDEIISNELPEKQYNNTIPEEPKQIEAEAPQYLPEDVDYEEVISEIEESSKQGEYIEYEEIANIEEPQQLRISEDSEIIGDATAKVRSKQNETIKKVIQALIAVITIVLLIFIITFIIKHWQLILYILGGVVVAAIIITLLLKKFKNKKS